MSNHVQITIDGRTVDAVAGEMIIAAADRAGIYIPRFCYHKHLSVAANCRMCLVEVEKAPKPLPACATAVTDGMRVMTQSPVALDAQKSVMEFLLINHPLDCPICDQGGECELQDLAMGYGKDVSRFNDGKRSVADEDLGPLIATDMTRCIHCTRCVRFGEEIAGCPELGLVDRGNASKIRSYLRSGMHSELSGNVIDLCPVGALTSKPYRFKGRSWGYTAHPSVASHDALGSATEIHVVGKGYNHQVTVQRVLPRENPATNQTWLSDRDRFSYEGFDQERLLEPAVKEGQHWRNVTWEYALSKVADHLRAASQASTKAQPGMGAWIAPTATCEAGWLLTQLFQRLGSTSVDCRLTQLDMGSSTVEPVAPGLPLPLDGLAERARLAVIGCDLRHEQPLLAARVRHAVGQGASLSLLNPMDVGMTCEVAFEERCSMQHLAKRLAARVQAVAAQLGTPLPEGLTLPEDVTVDDADRAWASWWCEASPGLLLLGAWVWQAPNYTELRTLAQAIATMSQGHVGVLTPGPNTTGLWLMGAVSPTHAHDHWDGVAHQALPLRWLHQVEPDRDVANPAAAIESLRRSEHVVALTSFDSPVMRDACDVLLPLALPHESSGSYVNMSGEWLTFRATTAPAGQARPGWKVYAALGQLMQCKGFDVDDIAALQATCEQQALQGKAHVRERWGEASVPWTIAPINRHIEGFQRLGTWSMVDVDGTTRRAASLQAAHGGDREAVRLAPEDAERLGVADGDHVRCAQGHHAQVWPCTVDDRIAAGHVWLPMAYRGTDVAGDACLGACLGPVDVTLDNAGNADV